MTTEVFNPVGINPSICAVQRFLWPLAATCPTKKYTRPWSDFVLTRCTRCHQNGGRMTAPPFWRHLLRYDHLKNDNWEAHFIRSKLAFFDDPTNFQDSLQSPNGSADEKKHETPESQNIHISLVILLLIFTRFAASSTPNNIQIHMCKKCQFYQRL